MAVHNPPFLAPEIQTTMPAGLVMDVNLQGTRYRLQGTSEKVQGTGYKVQVRSYKVKGAKSRCFDDFHFSTGRATPMSTAKGMMSHGHEQLISCVHD
jgi:hypothetical protein